MKKQKNMNAAVPRSLRTRAWVLAGAFVVIGFGILTIQLYQLQIKDYQVYQAEAAEQQLSDTVLKANRGTIYDATGKILAKSTIVYNITADPALCNQEIVAEASRRLGDILQLSSDEIYQKLSDSGSQYKVLARKVSKPVADEVNNYVQELRARDKKAVLSIATEQVSTREYPYGAFMASVLGFCNDDGYHYGLEKSYDEELSGVDGRLISLKNAWGNEMDNEEAQVHEAEDGKNLVLTIDVNIQSIVEKYLSAAVASNNVQNRGCAIVMDVNTGEILAMASKPDFDPNDPYMIYDAGYQAQLEAAGDEEYNALQGALREKQWKNKAITEIYYPGSVFKLITAASALDSGIMNENQTYYCGGAYDVANGAVTYHCAATGDSITTTHGMQDMATALLNSCNIYFIQAAQAMGTGLVYNYFNSFGFTQTTGIDLPSETIYMQYYKADRMGESELASTAFGQAQKITAMQMVTAAAAVVNGGYLVTPHVVDNIQDAAGNTVKSVGTTIKRQVVSEAVSEKMRVMMENVMGKGQDGYAGRNAYVAGYRIGGKSGTSEQLDEELRESDGDWKKVSSFIAALPIDDPQIIVFAMLDDPRAATDYASTIASPIVGNIISEVAPYLGLETDGTVENGSVTVPNCVETDWTLAQVALNKKGLSHRLVGTGGNVTWQYPYAGAVVPTGTTVYLYTEAGEDTYVSVPDVSGKNTDFAAQMLRAASLNVLVEGSGTVQSQSINPGDQTPMGTVVTIYASAEEPTAAEDAHLAEESVQEESGT